jgi:methylmalonyl-CoA mutase
MLVKASGIYFRLLRCEACNVIDSLRYGAGHHSSKKIIMQEYADIVCINKFDKAGALDALHDVRKQVLTANRVSMECKERKIARYRTIASAI